MRKLMYSMMVSLDGFIEGPHGEIDWVIVEEELHRFANQQARESGVFLYGRRLYEAMRYWQTAEADSSLPDYAIEFARIWREKPKVVFSHTLDKVEGNSRLAAGDLADEIQRLKAEPGQDITIGGAHLAAAAVRLGLVDEIQPIVHPVVLGSGTRFLPDVPARMNLRLVESRTFGTGVVYLRYVNEPLAATNPQEVVT
ncbi:MAG TPA: dihydrofolate reductase family protein [Candidatus Dormibacteraeota bacterium]|nr:dihydrofolate reductase family protein [Candidatus Dormibacteraeota bacterium]